jgi:hypothetical protein
VFLQTTLVCLYRFVVGTPMSYLPLFLFVCIELFVGAPMSYLRLFLFVCIELFVGAPISYLPFRNKGK